MAKELEEIDWSSINHTECTLLAQWVGFNGVTRAVPQPQIEHMINNLEPLKVNNSVDEYRQVMIKWLGSRWDSLKMQALHANCPDCYKCSDLQAVSCYVENKHQFK